jgi:tripartite-type tricarboxylate transporter receptor subunit TctC
MRKPAAWVACIAIVVCSALMPAPAPAQDPSRPVRIIAPLAAGSTFDLLARAVGSRLEQRTGRTVVVENRVGANMSIAAIACKSAAPDGQTICLFTHNLFLNPLINPKLNYDPVKDLAPIALLSYLEQVLVVSRRVPVSSYAEMVRYAKYRANTLNYGSVGVGSAAHVVVEWLRKQSGSDWKHVPFNGSPHVQAAMAAGDVHLTFTPAGNIMGRVASGNLKVLLASGEKRNPALPDVPTFREAGLPNLPAKSWAGLFAPAGTPADTITRLHQEFAAIAADPEFQRQHVLKLGLAPATMELAEFKTFVQSDQRAWEPLLREAGVRPN